MSLTPPSPLSVTGAYLKLRNEKYAFAVEYSLGASFLTSFFCDNHRDRVTLLRIFYQVIRNKQAFPEIITAPFQNRPYSDAPVCECVVRGAILSDSAAIEVHKQSMSRTFRCVDLSRLMYCKASTCAVYNALKSCAYIYIYIYYIYMYAMFLRGRDWIWMHACSLFDSI